MSPSPVHLELDNADQTSKLSTRVHMCNNKNVPIRLFAVNKLRDKGLTVYFQTLCNSKLQIININNDIESSWSDIKDAIYESAKETLGYVHRIGST